MDDKDCEVKGEKLVNAKCVFELSFVSLSQSSKSNRIVYGTRCYERQIQELGLVKELQGYPVIYRFLGIFDNYFCFLTK